MIPTLFFSFIVVLVDANQHFDFGIIRSAMKGSGTFIVHTTTPPSSFVLHSMICRWPDINVHLHLSQCILFRSKSISPFVVVHPHGYCGLLLICISAMLDWPPFEHMRWSSRYDWMDKCSWMIFKVKSTIIKIAPFSSMPSTYIPLESMNRLRSQPIESQVDIQHFIIDRHDIHLSCTMLWLGRHSSGIIVIQINQEHCSRAIGSIWFLCDVSNMMILVLDNTCLFFCLDRIDKHHACTRSSSDRRAADDNVWFQCCAIDWWRSCRFHHNHRCTVQTRVSSNVLRWIQSQVLVYCDNPNEFLSSWLWSSFSTFSLITITSHRSVIPDCRSGSEALAEILPRIVVNKGATTKTVVPRNTSFGLPHSEDEYGSKVTRLSNSFSSYGSENRCLI